MGQRPTRSHDGAARRHERAAPSIPAINAVHLAELVERWGVTAAALFRGTSLRRAELSRPGARLPIATMVPLVERARQLTREPALGIYFGLQMRISWHGYLGLAAMASANVRQAVELAARFLPTLTDAFALDLELAGKKASLVLGERADFGAARDAIVLGLIVGLWQLGCTLTGRRLGGSADLAMDEPAYIRGFAGLMPGTLRFSRRENRLTVDAETLALPFVTADAAALAMTREQCERELDALGFAGPFAERVRSLALYGGGGARSLEEVAAQLHLSARTLKRRLAALDTSYSQLLDEERQRRALALLGTTTLTMDEIAERLGYTDVANFGRAFRRWTGKTPGRVRSLTQARGRAPEGAPARARSRS